MYKYKVIKEKFTVDYPGLHVKISIDINTRHGALAVLEFPASPGLLSHIHIVSCPTEKIGKRVCKSHEPFGWKLKEFDSYEAEE